MSNSVLASSMDTTYPLSSQAMLLRALTFIALVIDIPPLIWHIRGRNLAASTLVAYIVTSNFFNFINPYIWPTDNIASWWSGHGLCDIEVKLMIGISLGVNTALTCILRDLARVLNTERTVITRSDEERRRQLVDDCLLCYAAPIYLMAAHYVVQGNRYYILAIAGCNAGYDQSWASVVLIFMWPLIICLVNIFFASQVVYRTYRYQRNFATILASSSTTLTKARFYRLFAMAFTMIIIICPVEVYILYRNCNHLQYPYSWSRVHGPSFSKVVMVPTQGEVTFDRWIQVAAGYVVFCFFGTGRDAIKEYNRALLCVGLGAMFPSLVRTGNRVSVLLESQPDGSIVSDARLLDGRGRLANRFVRKFGFWL